MATSSRLPIFLLLLSLTHLAFARFPSSSVASDQIDYWSKNVLNSMPEAIVSKLSPLSNQNSASLASSLSKPSSYSGAMFCSMAHLACAATNIVLLSGNVYAYNINSVSKETSSDDAFFRLSTLQTGKKLQLPNLNDQFPPRAFLPTQIASKISITSSTDLQKLFPNSFTSLASKETMKMGISSCSSPNLKGEIKRCSKTLEEMIDFSKKTLGVTKLMALTSDSTRGTSEELEIGNIRQYDAKKVVSCHEVFFPFAAYVCHMLSSTRLYKVDFVEPTTKAPVNTIIALCHMDTSDWPATHSAFKILKFSPGEGEACHWTSKIDLVWIGNGEEKL